MFIVGDCGTSRFRCTAFFFFRVLCIFMLGLLGWLYFHHFYYYTTMIRGAKHLYAFLRYRIIGMETHGNNGPGQNAAIPSREKSFDLISAGFFLFFWSFWHFSPWDYETFHCHVARYLDAWWLSTITGAPNRPFPLARGEMFIFLGWLVKPIFLIPSGDI